MLIKTLLHSVLKTENNWQLQLLANWTNILGNLKTKVELLKIQGDILVLGVSDSCWMQELYLLSPLLLKTINENLDKPRIKQLRFKATGYKKKKTIKSFTQSDKRKRTIVLSEKEEKTLTTIEDSQLQSALRAYLIRCHQEK